MRYWEGPRARAATGGLPFAGHRTLAEEMRELEVLRQRLKSNKLLPGAALRKQLKPKDNDNGPRSPDL
jgi:adenylylsulfate kinase-like enzyme